MPTQVHLDNPRKAWCVQRRARSTFSFSCFFLIVLCCVGNNAAISSTAPAVSLSATSLYFGYFTVGATGGPENLFVTNSGTAPLTITSIILTGGNASDFSQTNNCGGSLAVGATCQVQVTFTPSSPGTRTTTLNITDNSTGSPQTVIFSGTATAAVSPVVSLSATSLYFGYFNVGTTGGPENLSVANTGNAPLTITSIILAGGNASDFSQSNNCGSSLAAGATCMVQVIFKPSAPGTRTTTLNITDNAAGSPQAVIFSGTATGTPPVVSLSATSLTFATQALGASSAAQAVTLNDTGTSALTLTSLALSGANPGDFIQTNNCGSSVAAGANCTISVTFKPTAIGTRTATLSMADSAVGSPQTVSLSGTGATTAPAASLSPTSLAFGNQSIGTTSAPHTVTLSNSGNAAMTLTSLALTGANASDFVQNNNCGASLAVGANCSVAVLFKPSAAGSRGATLSIADNANGSPQAVSLSGTGTHDVILSWTASPTSGVIGYNVYRGTTSRGESSTPLNSSLVYGTTYTDANVTAGVTYYYLVTAVMSNGVTQSAASSETSATVPSP